MEMVAGVVPLASEAESQAALDAAVNDRAAPMVETLSGFDGGAAAPATEVNVSEAGPTDSCEAGAMLRVTGTVTEVAPVAVNVSVPE